MENNEENVNSEEFINLDTSNTIDQSQRPQQFIKPSFNLGKATKMEQIHDNDLHQSRSINNLNNTNKINNNIKNSNLNNNSLKGLNNNNLKNPNNGLTDSTSNRINSARHKNSFSSGLQKNKSLSSNNNLDDKSKNNNESEKENDNSINKMNPFKNKNPLMNFLTGNKKKKETDLVEEVGVSVTTKMIKSVLIFILPAIAVFVLFVIIAVTSEIYFKVLGLGNADDVSGPDALQKIDGVVNRVAYNNDNTNNEIVYVAAKNNNFSSFKDLKLNSVNLILDNGYNAPIRESNEADLSKIEDYYSTLIDGSKDYDITMVQKFYKKLYYIQRYYHNNYHVYLDMPLLMSTLNMQYTDVLEIFNSNVKMYDSSTELNNTFFAYDYDWEGHVTSRDDSTHDIEILAQRMVSIKPEGNCSNPIRVYKEDYDMYHINDYTEYEEVTELSLDDPDQSEGVEVIKDKNGKIQRKIKRRKYKNICYVVDNEQYKDFLKEFLEKKYYLTSNNGLSANPNIVKKVVDIPGVDPGTPPVANGDWRNWKQCDPNWGSKSIGGRTMCDIGCTVTSITIQIARSGTATVTSPIDPGIALGYYGFSGELFQWGSTTNLAPNFVHHTTVNLTGLSKEGVASSLAPYNSPRYYIVLNVGKHGRGPHHWVALESIDGAGNIAMIDPMNASSDLYSIYNVYRAEVYEKRD